MISIVMPAYNAEKYIAKCINSVLCQTYNDFELIIVNDCSADGTLHICKQFAQKDKRIVLIDKKKNQGEDLSRFEGLQLARYEYVAFIDDDDYLPFNALKIMHDVAIAHNADMVMGNNTIKMCGGLLSFKRFLPKELCDKLYDHKGIMKTFYRGFFGHSIFNVALWAKLYRTSLIKRVFRPTGYKVGGDLVINMRIFPLLQSLYVTSDNVYNYRRGSGVTSHFMPNWMEDMKRLYHEKKKEMIAHDFVGQADFYLKVELINCLRTYVEQFITFKHSTRKENIALLQAELQDATYGELKGVKYRDKEILKSIIAKDAARLYARMEYLICHAPLKEKATRMVRRLMRVFA